MRRSVFLVVALVLAVQPCAAAVLRLNADEAAARAVSSSDLLSAADCTISAAQARADAADAERLPELRLAASLAQRSSVPELIAPLSGPDQPPVLLFPNIETVMQTGVQVEQVLYAGGAINAGRKAAEAETGSRRAERRTLLLDLQLEARMSYWRAVWAASELQAATAQEQRAERLRDDAQALRQAGMAVKADVLAAEARSWSARVQVINRGAASDNALAELRSLLHLAADQEVDLADGPDTPPPPPPTADEALAAEAVASRTELETVDQLVASLEQRERAVAAGRRPAVALAGLWDLARPNPRYMPLEDSWNDSWSVGVSASWTVFDGNRNRAQQASLRHQRLAVAAEREELERVIVLQVANSRRNLVAALTTIDAADAALAAAEAREQAAQERFEAGLAPISDVLDAQAELADAELGRARARAEAWMATARLHRAVGQ